MAMIITRAQIKWNMDNRALERAHVVVVVVVLATRLLVRAHFAFSSSSTATATNDMINNTGANNTLGDRACLVFKTICHQN